jgi:sarcosine oxidase
MTVVDVAVIAAGAAGSATAWWLARRGVDVVVLERFGAGHDRGSSHGASRIFRLAYPDKIYVQMAQESLPLWRELEDDAGEPLLDTTGAVDHGASASIDETAAALRARGVEHELLSAEAARERWPSMRFEGAVLFHPAGGRCRADATLAALQRRARTHGADVRHDVGVVSLVDTGSPDTVELRATAIETTWRARAVVVATGAWTASVVAGRVELPPLVVTQEQVQHFAPKGGQRERWPSFIHHRQPWVYGLETPGQGVKVARHHVGAVVDPDHRPPRDDTEDSVISRYVEEWFPGLDSTPTHVADCLYTTTPDESFVLDRAGRVVVGSACSGHGFKFTPLIGQRLAELAMEAMQAAR